MEDEEETDYEMIDEDDTNVDGEDQNRQKKMMLESILVAIIASNHRPEKWKYMEIEEFELMIQSPSLMKSEMHVAELKLFCDV